MVMNYRRTVANGDCPLYKSSSFLLLIYLQRRPQLVLASGFHNLNPSSAILEEVTEVH